MVAQPIEDEVLTGPQRLAAVRRTELALPARSVSADAAAHLAARVANAPSGLVSLVRRGDIHLAGLYGAPEDLMASRELPLTGTLCPVVVSTGYPLAIDDVSEHPEYACFDAIVRYNVRAYLGVPLRDERGQALGGVAAFDTSPRRWTDDDVLALLQLTELIGPFPPDDAFRDERRVPVPVLDAPGEVLVSVDDNGSVSAWNGVAERMFGWSAAEVFNRRIDEFLFDRNDWSRLRTKAVRELAAGEPPTLHRELLTAHHRDGRAFPVEALASVLDTPQGRQWGVVVLDAGEPAESERSPVRSAAFLHAVLDNLYTGVAACDAAGRLVFLNRAVREMLQLAQDAPATVQRALQDGLSRPDGTRFPATDTPLGQAMSGRSVRDIDLLFTPPDGPARAFVANAEPVRGANGTIAGAVLAVHDVTTQRRAERFRACELQVTTALATADSVGQVGSRIAEAVARTLGWPHVELWLVDRLSGTLQDVGHWTSPETHIEHLLGATVTKGVGITGTVWATGRPLWVPDTVHTAHLVTPESIRQAQACAEVGLRAVVAVPIEDGAPIGVLTCFADTPEYDEAELVSHLSVVAGHIGRFVAARRAEELSAQLNRTRDDFVALAGHELRTPLTSIASCTDLLLADPDTLPVDVAHLLGAISRNTASLTAIVDELLDLAALQGGHVVPRPRATDAVAVLRDRLAGVCAAAQANRVEIVADLPDRLIIRVDPQRFQQVVDNLLANAVKYSPDGGTVTVRLTTDSAVVLTVTDTGIGIPAEERTNLFRSFFRATNARHTIPGTGLGLATTRAIVEAHHGSIAVTHNDPGTTVTVRLPLPA